MGPLFQQSPTLEIHRHQRPGIKKRFGQSSQGECAPPGINEAPVIILVCVDRRIDPLHAIEAGAAATQNMALAACSLGLGAGWIGIWGTEAEASIQKLFELPETFG